MINTNWKRRKLSHLIKDIQEKPIPTIVLSNKKLKALPYNNEQGKDVCSTISTQYLWSEPKRNIRHSNYKGKIKTVFICRQYDCLGRKPWRLYKRTARTSLLGCKLKLGEVRGWDQKSNKDSVNCTEDSELHTKNNGKPPKGFVQQSGNTNYILEKTLWAPVQGMA